MVVQIGHLQDARKRHQNIFHSAFNSRRPMMSKVLTIAGKFQTRTRALFDKVVSSGAIRSVLIIHAWGGCYKASSMCEQLRIHSPELAIENPCRLFAP